MAMTVAERKKRQRSKKNAPTAEAITKATMEVIRYRLSGWCYDTRQKEPGISAIAHEVSDRFPMEHVGRVQNYLGVPYYDPDEPVHYDLVDPDLWNRLRDQADRLVQAHQAAAEEVGAPGPDAAWRTLMRDILAAVSSTFDGDRLAAAGALAEALAVVSTEQPAE